MYNESGDDDIHYGAVGGEVAFKSESKSLDELKEQRYLQNMNKKKYLKWLDAKSLPNSIDNFSMYLKSKKSPKIAE